METIKGGSMRFAIIISAVLVLFSPQFNIQAAPQDTLNIRRGLAVGRILTVEQDDRVGTGFAAGDKKYIYTCAHVALSDTMRFWPLGNSYWYKITLKWILDEYDLAVFERSAGEQECILPLGSFKSSNPGDSIITFGWKSNNLLQTDKTIITAYGSVINETETVDFLEFYAEAVPGYSGGPVLNFNGEVIGMMREAWTKQGIKGGSKILTIRAFSTDLLRILDKNLRKSISSDSTDSSTMKLMKMLEK